MYSDVFIIRRKNVIIAAFLTCESHKLKCNLNADNFYKPTIIKQVEKLHRDIVAFYLEKLIYLVSFIQQDKKNICC